MDRWVCREWEKANQDLNRPKTGQDIAALLCAVQDNRFYFNYHHTAADTFDKVDPKHLGENAAVLAYALADSAEPAPR